MDVQQRTGTKMVGNGLSGHLMSNLVRMLVRLGCTHRSQRRRSWRHLSSGDSVVKGFGLREFDNTLSKQLRQPSVAVEQKAQGHGRWDITNVQLIDGQVESVERVRGDHATGDSDVLTC